MRRVLAPALTLAALVAAWQLAVDHGVFDRLIVPSPSDVATALWDNRSLLWRCTWVTLREVLLGFGCALVFGIAAAVCLHASALFRHATYPILIASQTIPIVVIAPLFVTWFGFGLTTKLAFVALVCFFPITVSTLDGLRSADPGLLRMMRSLDASRLALFRRVEAPGALPRMFSGAKIAAAIAVIGAVFGEDAGTTPGSQGLGYLIMIDNGLLETERVFASVLILSLIGIALFGAIALAERLVVRWS